MSEGPQQSAMEIRLATESDLPGMVSLLGVLFAQEADFAPDPEAQARGLRALLADPGAGRLLVADDGDQLLGMVNLLYTTSTALGAPVALLEDMVVAEAARGMGVGQRLVEAAAAQCRADGCKRITLLTDVDNRRAHAFYERGGFSRSERFVFCRFL